MCARPGQRVCSLPGCSEHALRSLLVPCRLEALSCLPPLCACRSSSVHLAAAAHRRTPGNKKTRKTQQDCGDNTKSAPQRDWREGGSRNGPVGGFPTPSDGPSPWRAGYTAPRHSGIGGRVGGSRNGPVGGFPTPSDGPSPWRAGYTAPRHSGIGGRVGGSRNGPVGGFPTPSDGPSPWRAGLHCTTPQRDWREGGGSRNGHVGGFPTPSDGPSQLEGRATPFAPRHSGIGGRVGGSRNGPVGGFPTPSDGPSQKFRIGGQTSGPLKPTSNPSLLSQKSCDKRFRVFDKLDVNFQDPSCLC